VARSKLFSNAIKISLVLVTILSLLIFIADSIEEPILIQSLESKTVKGGPVFNKIKRIAFTDKDVWMMNQSHEGLTANPEKWDRLAIVVSKSSPKTARFLQLPPGPLEWTDELEKSRTPNRVACFMCHSNGPRGVYPDSQNLKVSAFSSLRLQLWNLRIKVAGRIQEDPRHAAEDEKLNIPYRFASKRDNEPLTVAVCMKCHRESGLFARGSLTRQNSIVIAHMLETKHMPPPGFALSDQDQLALSNFLQGF
jgi:hypothetical protein